MTESAVAPGATFFDTTPAMETAGRTAVALLLDRFAGAGLTADGFGLVVLRGDASLRPTGFSYRGDWRCYPCSVVKAFHLVHALVLLDEGRIAPHAELDRALRDMILWSSNMATNYVIDIITGTTGDTLLDGPAWDEWRHRRDGLNRFFRALGWAEFATSNITQKLMDDMRYGREARYAGVEGENMNALTPLAAARLFAELFGDGLPLSPDARRRAQDILVRDRRGPDAGNPLFQVDTYLGGGIPAGLPLWSKAGRLAWTGDARVAYHKHDLIRTIPADGVPLVISLMTRGKGLCEDNPRAFPEIGRLLFEAFST
ncbi:class A beta-lactamase-related serine hydrolase [Aurantimonas sp. MSK8Z-1]|uniref:class A beta-lactamase-related serine hydrolase n=1 Tax=Mangrovibrevibacter kandeliae TaxID=2968473 RepID=UPI002119AE1D|nr:class A beta-lactamase-related serine hydrolase [Aurantimonas sp. MSK8Z-1]MCW4115902.1 class A beta-lactamase-related serine hydrolase [Aurantimonas sp. MSK8Z-1]